MTMSSKLHKHITNRMMSMYGLIFNGINLKMNKYIKNWKIKFHMQLYIYIFKP